MTTYYGSGTLRIPIARWELRGTKPCAFSKKRPAQKWNLKNAVLNKFALPLARCSIQIRRPMFSNTTKAMQLLDYSPARGCYENLKIGRASCRERVEVAVGGGAVKEKKEQGDDSYIVEETT